MLKNKTGLLTDLSPISNKLRNLKEYFRNFISKLKLNQSHTTYMFSGSLNTENEKFFKNKVILLIN